jgi:hypothetical protein
VARSKLRYAPYGIAVLHRNALRKGVLGGSRPWMFVGVLIWVPRVAFRLLARQERVVAVEKLTPGQFVRIEAFQQPTKRELKKAAKSAK